MLMFKDFRETLQDIGYHYYRRDERPIILDMEGNDIEEFKGQYDGKGKGVIYFFSLGQKTPIRTGDVERPGLSLITDFVSPDFFKKDSNLDSLFMPDSFVLAAQGICPSNEGEMNIDSLQETDPILYRSAKMIARIAGSHHAQVEIKEEFSGMGGGYAEQVVKEGRFYTYVKEANGFRLREAILAVSDAFVLFDNLLKHHARVSITGFMSDPKNQEYASLIGFDPEKSFQRL